MDTFTHQNIDALRLKKTDVDLQIAILDTVIDRIVRYILIWETELDDTFNEFDKAYYRIRNNIQFSSSTREKVIQILEGEMKFFLSLQHLNYEYEKFIRNLYRITAESITQKQHLFLIILLRFIRIESCGSSPGDIEVIIQNKETLRLNLLSVFNKRSNSRALSQMILLLSSFYGDINVSDIGNMKLFFKRQIK